MSIVLNGTTGITTPDVTSDGLTVDSTTLVVDEANNRVGIGTSSPTQKLTIEGAMNLLNGSRAGAFEIDSSGNLWVGTATTAGNIIFESGHSTTGLPSTGGERARILSSGGITFNGDTAAANALDDYEEGTWTPIIKGTSTNPSYTTSVAAGNYVKIGKMVYVSFLVIVTGVSSQGTGNIYLDTLPFTVNDQSYAPSLTVMYNDTWDVDFRAMYANGTSWTMRPLGNTQANATWGGSSALSTGYFSGSGCYLAT